MSHGEHFTLFTDVRGPNGWKVAEPKYLDFSKQEQKSPEHTQYNPNGRIPTLIDHANNDFVVWESNAILLYLVEKYDTEHKISVSVVNEKVHQLQWLFFQASGQGPYYGQATWFIRYHPEKIPSAIERYRKEVIRVIGVLESVLSKQDWVVGGKCTIADISFVPWNIFAFRRLSTDDSDVNLERDFPAVTKWHNAMLKRHAIAEQIKLRQSLLEEQT
ncbi:glutathione S-transferase [Rhodofomes roseus]|uniref:Glutathione S-transferase n=1 Tax=Rhodofomes roseus TaxID=34475 RepID=A0ABQ8K978_9APHY|nr:glutathione S-transferase [Rhodofomes roseus]KAH9833867.1 glutathione S-transferase [Rhodofomes roseus]